MNVYIRESKSLGDGKRLITHYTPGEYLFLSIIKFLFFLFVLWPLEITLIIIVFFLKVIWFCITLPFKLIIKLFQRE